VDARGARVVDAWFGQAVDQGVGERYHPVISRLIGATGDAADTDDRTGSAGAPGAAAGDDSAPRQAAAGDSSAPR
jgi:hypothetical protein